MDSIVKSIFNGNAVLFLGSGFSLDARNALGACIPSVGTLASDLLVAIGVPQDEALKTSDQLIDVVDYCLSSEDGEVATVSRLRQLFSVTELAPWQRDLVAGLPWKRIYTTNFDNAVEIAFANSGKPLSVLSAMAPFEKPIAADNSCTVIHINGVANNITAKTINTQLRLSGKSYATNDFVSSKWAQLFASDIAYCDMAVFVGFSLGDLDIGRIVIAQLSKRRTHFFNGRAVSKMARAKLENFGTVHALSGQELVNEVRRLAIGLNPSPDRRVALVSFERCRLSSDLKAPDDADRRDLLLFGKADNSLIQSSIASGVTGNSLIDRTVEQDVARELASGSDVAILSALGNGKSILLRKLAFLLASDGWEVFVLRDMTGNWLREVEYICNLRGKIVLVIDGAADCLNILEAIGQRRPSSLRLLMAERTRRYEARFSEERLESIGVSDIVEHEIDLLDDSERNRLDELLSSAGLWGRSAAMTKSQRNQFLIRSCRNELSSALLHVVRSEDIAKRIQEAMEVDRFSHSDLQVLAVAVALTVFGFRLPVLDLGRLCGASSANQFLRAQSEFRDKLYEVSGGEFKTHSNIFGEYFLRDLVPSAVVLDGLSAAIRNALSFGIRLSEVDLDDDDEVWSRKANSFPAPMYVFRNIQQIVDVEEDFDAVFSFYERIKDKTRLSDDPLFWLQYAIAKLFSGDRESAKNYLENSYGIAKRTGFRTYQIDNQYARWLLESAISTGDSLEAFTAFDDAHGIIVNQLADHSHAHYPFRIAIQYKDFYLHHQHALNVPQKEYVLNAARSVLAAAKYAQVEISKRHWVVKCKRELERLEQYILSLQAE